MSCSRPAYIYCITNLVNGKKYVGKTNNPVRRWRDHKRDSQDEEHHQAGKLLYRAMRKHGLSNFRFQIIAQYSSDQEALASEDDWIKQLRTLATQHGYNCSPGGAGPDKQGKKRKKRQTIQHTSKSKQKMSISMSAVHDSKRRARIDTLIRLHSAGLNNAEIAKHMDITVVTVRDGLSRVSLVSNALKPPPNVPEILRLSQQGKTAMQISKAVNSKPSTVRRILKEHGMVVNREDTIGKQRKTAIATWLRAEGFSNEDICTITGIAGCCHVYKYIRKA